MDEGEEEQRIEEEVVKKKKQYDKMEKKEWVIEKEEEEEASRRRIGGKGDSWIIEVKVEGCETTTTGKKIVMARTIWRMGYLKLGDDVVLVKQFKSNVLEGVVRADLVEFKDVEVPLVEAALEKQDDVGGEGYAHAAGHATINPEEHDPEFIN